MPRTAAVPRRDFLASALAMAAATARRPAEAHAAGKKIDIHVHLGVSQQQMFQMSADKVSAAVKYLTGEMDRNGIEQALIVAVEPVFPTELYLQAAKLEPERLIPACSVFPRPTNEAI